MLFLEEGDSCFNLLWAQLNPLAANFNKGKLQVDQVLEFLGRERGIANGDGPVVGDNTILTEQA